jgi:hypothetical protein
MTLCIEKTFISTILKYLTKGVTISKKIYVENYNSKTITII